MTSELKRGYSFRNDIITNPGKFEGESLATLYFYDCFLNGGNTIMEVSDDEKKEFRLNDSDNWVYLEESGNGFVTLRYFEDYDAAESYSLDVEPLED